MTDSILVPFDGSEQAERALQFAFEEYDDAQVRALYVVDPSEFYAATGIEGGALGDYDDVLDSELETAEATLEAAVEMADAAGRDLETDHVIGSVSRSVIEYVDDHDVDHVVVGSHGRTGAKRILLGSVAERIARRSPVPVTVVR